jgi:choline kinase
MFSFMKAIILAAGPGSRMLPHTEHRPKCLLKIGGHPILHYQLAGLRHCGVHDITVVVGYLAEQIKEFVTTPVTFVENREFRDTGSSYSLWLARESMRDGFLYLNSDLVFHPDMLKALLDSPDENAVIVERRIVPTSDMQKAQMDGRLILQMGKHLPADVAAAEVVGPVKFGAAGAARIIERLDELVQAGDRNRWAYEVFGTVGPEIAFSGVDNPGCFWAEVDTATEALEANQRIPRALVDFADGRISAPPRVERRRAPAIDQQPVHYLDHLLNSHFAPLVDGLPDADARVRQALKRNKQEFIDKVGELGMSSLSAIDIHRALQATVERIDGSLEKVFGRDCVASVDGLRAMTTQIEGLCPRPLQVGFCLTETRDGPSRAPSSIIMMDALGCRWHQSCSARAPSPIDFTRATEDRRGRLDKSCWGAVRRRFRARAIRFLPVDAARYLRPIRSSRENWRAAQQRGRSGGVSDATIRPACARHFCCALVACLFLRGCLRLDTIHSSRHAIRGLGRAVVSVRSHREADVLLLNMLWRTCSGSALELFAGAFRGPDRLVPLRQRLRRCCLSTGVRTSSCP